MIGRLGERAGAFFQNYKTHFGKCLYLTEPCCFTWPPRWLANRISPEYRNHRWDFPCCAWSTLLTCRRHYPGRSDGIYSLVRFHSLRPSPKPGRVGSCISLFEACSAFTHVTACTLAKSPSDSLHQRLQQFRCLHYCSDCYRAERTSSRAGLSPAMDHHLSRRTR
jgi:hypothetical protein